MQTRRGICYGYLNTSSTTPISPVRAVTTVAAANNMDAEGPEKRRRKRSRRGDGKDEMVLGWKRLRTCGAPPTPAEAGEGSNSRRIGDYFDVVPDDIVLLVLSKLSSTASSSADLAFVQSTCKRLRELCLHPQVLSKASPKSLAVTAENWSESAHRFVKQCADAGNLEACYLLGMIRFYCLQNRPSGASLLAKAAMGSHAAAVYSLAVIQFNGSGGSKADKDLRAGVALCARAAYLGHIDALRELGHCLQDGYGIRQNVSEGRRFLVQANARELAEVISAGNKTTPLCHSHRPGTGVSCPLLSDFGCHVPQPEMHPANRFLVDWFASRKRVGGWGGVQPDVEVSESESETGLRLCSHVGCGRPETRRHEFRRCSVCGTVNYCSRACQALDWKLRHKADCAAMERWVEDVDAGAGAAGWDLDP